MARRGDAGFGLIEAVVALMLLAIIVVPITHIVITTLNASDTLHLRAEAADLATQALETAQYQTANGVVPTSGITTSTQYSGKDAFSVTLDYELSSQAGASASICTAPPGQTSSEIWSVKATIAWGTGAMHGQVVETTLISPASADLANINAGEIAVPIYNADDQTLETGAKINVSVSGSCVGTQCAGEAVPAGEATSESANTGTTGCAVFPDLYAGAGWTYTVSVSGNSLYVDPSELSDAPTASGVPTRTNVAVQPDAVTVVANPNIIYALGAQMAVNFTTYGFTGAASTIAPAADLPISVQSSTLLCSSPAAETCVLGNGTATGGFSSTTPTPTPPALLFPGPPQVGTAANYTAWAGDQADSIPTNGDYGSSTLPKSFVANSDTTGSVTLPVYPLVLNVTAGSGVVVTALNATDAGGGDTLTINPVVAGTSSTGLPLGQFELSVTDTGGTSTLSTGGSSPVYVWILPTGVCVSSIEMSSPCSSPSTTAIAVTAS